MEISREMIISLITCGLFITAVSCVLYTMKRKTAFSRIPHIVQDIIAGVVLGGAAIVCTESAIYFGVSEITVRDAAPLCASIFFGPVAGIISGLIAGVERWFAVNWGADAYTKVASTAAVIFAGLYGSFLRLVVFDEKRPSWFLAFVTGVTTEIMHMIILFIAHIKEPVYAYYLVSGYTIPLVIAIGMTFMITDVGIQHLSQRLHKEENRSGTIAQSMQTRLLVNVVLAYMLSTMFVFFLQTYTSIETAESTMLANNRDVYLEIMDTVDDNMISAARQAAYRVENSDEIDLYALCEEVDATDIWIVDTNGIVVDSTDDNIGYDMNSDAELPEDERQSSEFMVLLTGEKDEYVQRYMTLAAERNKSDDTSETPARKEDSDVYGTKLKQYETTHNKIKRKIAGVTLSEGGFIQIGYDAGKLKNAIIKVADGITRNRRVGENGYIIIAGMNGRIISNRDDIKEKYLEDVGIFLDDDIDIGEAVNVTVSGVDSYIVIDEADGFYIISVMLSDEIFETRSASTYVNSFLEILIFTALFINITVLIRISIVKDLNKINMGLSRITEGELGISIDVRTTQEFKALSDGVNKTVDSLKNYIDEAEKRIDKELAFARDIQLAVLPSVFPPYPDKKQFDIFASMHTAREVGGDFYDFFMQDDKHIAIVIADVSGKGIPAAMFMMTAKTMLKNLAQTGMPVNEVFSSANDRLCEGNEAGMFVTAWLGILNIENGHMDYVNAGHNPPLIYRRGEGFGYMEQRRGFVLAGMEGVKYKMGELELRPGDRILLYTDGATEAVNTSKELYGEDRLAGYLNAHYSDDVTALLNGVKTDIDAFAGEAEQFDDITLLVLDYKGSEENGMEFEASDEALGEASAYIEDILSECNVSMKDINMISVAFEELFVNVAHYAYPGSHGKVNVSCKVENGWAVITMKDRGIQFDPFINKEPDITLNAEERGIGGLGIFMTKRIMDEYEYKYSEGQNIVTVKKKV